MMKVRKPTTQGLKARSLWRKEPNKGYLPRDNDGAYRVDGRRDDMSVAHVWMVAADRRGG